MKIPLTECSISVIMPVFNEVLLLDPSIHTIDAFLSANFLDYEILIIESGSIDGSGEVSDRLADSLVHVRVIHEGKKGGYGSALKIGFKNAKKNLLWVVTADLPFALDHILTACPLFEKYDCVLSYRVDDNRDMSRKLRSMIYNFLAKIILGINVKHVNSAFKVFDRQMVLSLDIISNGWTIDGEIIREITLRGISYTEIPVAIIERSMGQSSITASDPLKMILNLIEVRKKTENVKDV
ncbi:MAG: glycosyltransferase family 2 protein [Chloroflexota bacterium]